MKKFGSYTYLNFFQKGDWILKIIFLNNSTKQLVAYTIIKIQYYLTKMKY